MGNAEGDSERGISTVKEDNRLNPGLSANGVYSGVLAAIAEEGESSGAALVEVDEPIETVSDFFL
jgi:hypothetical protein